MAGARGTPRFGVTRPVTRTPIVEEIVPNSGWTEDSAGHYLLVDLPEFMKEDVKLQVDSSGRIVVKGERQASEQKRVHFHLSFPAPSDSEVDKITGKFDAGMLYVTLPKRIIHEKNKESDTDKVGIHEVQRAEENNSHTTSENAHMRDYSKHEEHVGHEDLNEHVGHDDLNQHVGHEDLNEHVGHDDLNQHIGHEDLNEHVDHDDLNQHVGHEDLNEHVGHKEHEKERNEDAHMGNFSEQVIKKWDQEAMLRSAVDVLSKNKGIVATAVIAFSLGIYVSSKFQFSEAP